MSTAITEVAPPQPQHQIPQVELTPNVWLRPEYSVGTVEEPVVVKYAPTREGTVDYAIEISSPGETVDWEENPLTEEDLNALGI